MSLWAGSGSWCAYPVILSAKRVAIANAIAECGQHFVVLSIAAPARFALLSADLRVEPARKANRDLSWDLAEVRLPYGFISVIHIAIEIGIALRVYGVRGAFEFLPNNPVACVHASIEIEVAG